MLKNGRLRAPVEAVASDIVSAGGSAEAAAVDALDEQAVRQHLQSVIDQAGRIDISFHAIGIPDANILGVPLVDLDVERFSLPITSYITSYFLTARLAARLSLRAARQGIGDDLGAVARAARGQNPRATADDVERDGQRSGLRRFRQRERDDGNHRQLDDGQPG